MALVVSNPPTRLWQATLPDCVQAGSLFPKGRTPRGFNFLPKNLILVKTIRYFLKYRR